MTMVYFKLAISLLFASIIGVSSAAFLFNPFGGTAAAAPATAEQFHNQHQLQPQAYAPAHSFEAPANNLFHTALSNPLLSSVDTPAYPVIGRESSIAVNPFSTSRYLPSLKSVEPYLSLYIPTGKCGKGTYCRAMLTAYYNQQARTVTVNVGYTVFSTTDESMGIRPVYIARISHTSNFEYSLYVRLLVRAMKHELPKLCKIDERFATGALKKAAQSMATCSEMENYSCWRGQPVTTCAA